MKAKTQNQKPKTKHVWISLPGETNASPEWIAWAEKRIKAMTPPKLSFFRDIIRWAKSPKLVGCK